MLDELPASAFIGPDGETSGAARALLAAVVDLLTSAAATDPPTPVADDAQQQTPRSIPEAPGGDDAVISTVLHALRGSIDPRAPRFMAHMDPPSCTASIVGDLVASAVNNNMLSVELSPFFSRLEVDLSTTLARSFGLGRGSGGVLCSGGTLANLHALTVARNAATGSHDDGIDAKRHRPVVLASRALHTSIDKAASILGLGPGGVVHVDTDPDDRLSLPALLAALERVEAEGSHPVCVVATCGTTTTGAIDPLREIGEVAKARGLWFHVDAAYGGGLVASTRHREKLDGIELADSVTFNPQKMWYVAKTCAMVLFRDLASAQRCFRVGAPYMATPDDLVNLGEVSVQGTRRPDALKLWLTLQHLGRVGLERLIDHTFEIRDHLVEGIRARPELQLAGAVDTNIVCFRAAPAWCPAGDLDALNLGLRAHLLESAGVAVSAPTWNGDRWLRIVPLNPRTSASDVAAALGAIDAFLSSARPDVR